MLGVVAVGGYLVKTQLLDDEQDAGPGVPQISIEILRPGAFAADHPYAPYYVVPAKRFEDPSELTRLARNKLVTKPESALSKGALAGSPQIVRLSLRATSDEPVTVDAVRFKIISKAKPLRGWYTTLTSCTLTAVPRAKLHLDSRRTSVRYVATDESRSRNLALKLDKGAPRILELQAATTRHRIAWTAELVVRDKDGRAAMITIDDQSEPFRVTSAADSQAYRPIYGASGIIGYARQRGVKDCA